MSVGNVPDAQLGKVNYQYAMFTYGQEPEVLRTSNQSR